MSRLEEIFDQTISEYNKNTSDINKFKFSQREKDIFKGMIRRYAAECCRATLEKASEMVILDFGTDEDGDYISVDKNSITNPDNITLL